MSLAEPHGPAAASLGEHLVRRGQGAYSGGRTSGAQGAYASGRPSAGQGGYAGNRPAGGQGAYAGNRPNAGQGGRASAGQLPARGDGNRGNNNNINRGDIKVGNDNNIDGDNDWGWGGWDDHPIGAGIAFGTAAAVTSAAIYGSMYYALPYGCSPYYGSYYSCGGMYYEPRYEGDTVVYVTVPDPAQEQPPPPPPPPQ